MDSDRQRQLRELAKQRVANLLAGPKLSALAPGQEKGAAEKRASVTPATDSALSAKDKSWDLSLLRASIEDLLNGVGDLMVTSHAAYPALIETARDMGEETLAAVLEDMLRRGNGSLESYAEAILPQASQANPWLSAFVVGIAQIQKHGRHVRVSAEHDIEDIAGILNDEDEVVFTSERRLRQCVERAHVEEFDTLEQLLRDLLAAKTLCITGLALAVKRSSFPGLIHRSTAEFLCATVPGLGTVDGLLALGRTFGAAAEPSEGGERRGYVYVMADPGTNGLLKIGQTANHPEVRLHQLNKETSRVYPLQLLDYWDCANPAAVERELHRMLSAYRVTQSREFFATELETVRQAVRSLLD